MGMAVQLMVRLLADICDGPAPEAGLLLKTVAARFTCTVWSAENSLARIIAYN